MPPYLENGTAMLQDMLTAYQAGAKYIVVFNYPTYPEANPVRNPDAGSIRRHGRILESNTLQPKKHVWNRKCTSGSCSAKRLWLGHEKSATDLIWGIWNSDGLSPIIWNSMNQLLKTYGSRLDIIYNDTEFNFTEKYSKIYYWNGTEIK